MFDFYLTVKEVARIMEVKQETVRVWIREGKLKAKMVNKRRGYSILCTDLEQFIKEHPRYRVTAMGALAARRAAHIHMMVRWAVNHPDSVKRLEETVRRIKEKRKVNQ